jgi:photosystem II stability/assembly factor-like uncharacterized protein
MKNTFLLLLYVLVLVGCSTKSKIENLTVSNNYQSVSIDTLVLDKIQIRALLVDDNTFWYSGDKGRFGFYDLASNQKFESIIKKDTLKLEFRSIAKTKNHIYVLSISSPALMYQISKKTKEIKLVYQENDKKVFYDSMQFWNDKDGIAVGDPINKCFSIIITHDGGNSWKKTACNQLPETFEGEAAFAASNTNIVINGNHTWIVSGGKKSRVFYSSDKAKSWEVFETPIVQGKEMTGIFTADFYNDKMGFVAGGNYEIPNQNFENKAVTADGGKTWQLIAENQGFGIASCMQYVPKSGGKELVSVGATGIYYSADSGATWKQFSPDSKLYTLRFLDNQTAIAAGYDKIVRINFKK